VNGLKGDRRPPRLGRHLKVSKLPHLSDRPKALWTGVRKCIRFLTVLLWLYLISESKPQGVISVLSANVPEEWVVFSQSSHIGKIDVRLNGFQAVRTVEKTAEFYGEPAYNHEPCGESSIPRAAAESTMLCMHIQTHVLIINQQMMSQLPSHIRVKARHALVKDDEEIAGFIRQILSSETKIIEVLNLDGDDAKQFMSLLKIVRSSYFNLCCTLMVDGRFAINAVEIPIFAEK
jgi:hypothetical protein